VARTRVKSVTKRYAGHFVAVKDLDLAIRHKEFVVLLGPSGCGKSTTLNMIAGLEDVTEGELWFDEQIVNALPPHRRDVAMVFQSYALYPHKTVYENIAFGLRMRKVNGAEIDHRVRDAAAKLEIAHLLQRRPSQLSGGQRQRVALGGEGPLFRCGELEIALPAKFAAGLRDQDERAVVLGLRPEDVCAAEAAGPGLTLAGVVDSVLPVGSDRFLGLKVEGRDVFVRVDKEARHQEGVPIGLGLVAERLHLFDKASGLTLAGEGAP